MDILKGRHGRNINLKQLVVQRCQVDTAENASASVFQELVKEVEWIDVTVMESDSEFEFDWDEHVLDISPAWTEAGPQVDLGFRFFTDD